MKDDDHGLTTGLYSVSRGVGTALGPVLAVRPYCDNAHYWQVYFDTNRVIRETFGEAGFPAPEQHVFIRSVA